MSAGPKLFQLRVLDVHGSPDPEVFTSQFEVPVPIITEHELSAEQRPQVSPGTPTEHYRFHLQQRTNGHNLMNVVLPILYKLMSARVRTCCDLRVLLCV